MVHSKCKVPISYSQYTTIRQAIYLPSKHTFKLLFRYNTSLFFLQSGIEKHRKKLTHTEVLVLVHSLLILIVFKFSFRFCCEKLICVFPRLHLYEKMLMDGETIHYHSTFLTCYVAQYYYWFCLLFRFLSPLYIFYWTRREGLDLVCHALNTLQTFVR